jgi:serine/threonine protein phosphatase PrpC
MDSPFWRVAAASVCGASHEKTGQPCQDAHHWAALPDGTVLAAVADGAGSAALSEIGATVATQTAVQFLATALASHPPAPPEGRGSANIPVRPELAAPPEADKNVRAPAAALAPDAEQLAGPADAEESAFKACLIAAVKAARAAVEAEASARGTAARELACTLLVALVRPDFIAVAQVGDGAVVAADASGEVFALTTPSSGEYLNETSFLTSPDILDLQVSVWRGALAHWAMFTDGLQMLALRMPGGTPHPPFFAPLFQFLATQPDPAQAQAALAGFLRSPRLRERADDDLTLLLAARSG